MKPAKIPIRCTYTRLVSPAKLKPNPSNPNKHPESQLVLYGKVIAHHGWRRAVVVSKRSGLIVTGHGAVETALLMGWATVPVDDQDFVSAEDETAHMIADNRLAELAELDDAALAGLLKDLDGKMDLDLTGFDKDGLADLDLGGALEVDAEPQIDRAAQLQKEWKTKRGQIWELGTHRLMCGSCLEDRDLDLLTKGKRISFVYSDAPYGISIVNPLGKVSTGLPVGPAQCRAEKIREVGGDKAFGKVGGIHRGMKARPIIPANVYANVIGDDDGKTARAAFLFLYSKFPKALHIWFGANHFSDVFPASSCWIVWDKENGESFFADGELAWCSAKTSVRIFKHQWNGLLKASERGQRRCHPTQKPVALAVWCLENYGNPEDKILDPFSGSGSCLLGCENLNRRCYAMEIDPGYVAVALQRWADATGKTPKLIA